MMLHLLLVLFKDLLVSFLSQFALATLLCFQRAILILVEKGSTHLLPELIKCTLQVNHNFLLDSLLLNNVIGAVSQFLTLALCPALLPLFLSFFLAGFLLQSLLLIQRILILFLAMDHLDKISALGAGLLLTFTLLAIALGFLVEKEAAKVNL